ncbi:hypothetical protein FOL46_008188 [Perkinsus olseni]|uniref:Uncharacterized protein n=1 Tax=Perkinsus olseni TaxID=32597 RepID=A0A7J6L8V1_PEROL|nr:hypothetical protein FOL46_008188 [Perkinsus olseni]
MDLINGEPSAAGLQEQPLDHTTIKIRPVCGPIDPKVEETASERVSRLRNVISERLGSKRENAGLRVTTPLLTFDKLRDDVGGEGEGGLVVEFTDRRRKSCGRNTLRKFLDRNKAFGVRRGPTRGARGRTTPSGQRPSLSEEALAFSGDANVRNPPEALGAAAESRSTTADRFTPSLSCRGAEDLMTADGTTSGCTSQGRFPLLGVQQQESNSSGVNGIQRSRKLRRSISEPDLAILREADYTGVDEMPDECNSEPEALVRETRRGKRRKRKKNRFIDDAASESGSGASAEEDDEDGDDDGYLSDFIATSSESDASECDPRLLHRKWEDDMGDRMLKGIFQRGTSAVQSDRTTESITRRVSLGMQDSSSRINLTRAVGFVKRRSSRGRPAGGFLSRKSLSGDSSTRPRIGNFVATTGVRAKQGVKRFIFGA